MFNITYKSPLVNRIYSALRSRARIYKFKKNDIIIHPNSYIDAKVIIGKGTRINGPAYLTKCRIGQFCAIAGNLQVRSTNHATQYLALQSHFQKDILKSSVQLHGQQKSGVTIGANVWIGTNVILLDGTDVGHSSIVAAGSVVNKKFPPFSIVGGVPAKLISMRFSPEICSNLHFVEWWHLSQPQLNKMKSLFEEELDVDNSERIKQAYEYFHNT